ncbi:MAG: hypothetical protein M0C28_39560 [Candidatus Moduliflexus flocculans]|nr:hypothetical protein [Candidatus Moduliflexus flocculans]
MGLVPALRLCLDPRERRLQLAPLHPGPLGLVRLWLDLGFARALGLDRLPLRPLGLGQALGLVLGARRRLGSGLGGLAMGDAHIGWAPLPPGIDFVPGRGFGNPRWDFPGDHWCFVHGRYFMDRTLDRRILPIERNLTIVNMTSLRVNIDATTASSTKASTGTSSAG